MTTAPEEILTLESEIPADEKVNRTRKRFRFLKPFLYGMLFLVVLTAIAVWYAVNTAQKVPDFYAQVLDVEPHYLEHGGDEFERNIALLNNAFRRTYPWKITFTQEQINGWLASDMPEKFPNLIPPEISDPRIVFTENEAKLAFKFSKQGITGIVVATADVFCTQKPNEIAVKLKQVKSGVVSLPIGPWLEKLTERFQIAGVDMIWSEENGEPVALITIPDEVARNGLHRYVIVEAIDLRPGRLVIAGSSVRRHPPATPNNDQSRNSIPSKNSTKNR